MATTIISSINVKPRAGVFGFFQGSSRLWIITSGRRFKPASLLSAPSSSATTGAMIDSLSPSSKRRKAVALGVPPDDGQVFRVDAHGHALFGHQHEIVVVGDQLHADDGAVPVRRLDGDDPAAAAVLVAVLRQLGALAVAELAPRHQRLARGRGS
jgi:hypothetical protein